MSADARETAGTNGTAVELSLKEKRAIREEARREYKASERARMEQDATKKAGAPETAAGAPAAQPATPPVEPDAVLASWAAVFLRGVLYPVVSLGARLFGGALDLDRYTEARAKDEAAAWTPLLREYALLRAVVKWTTVPARIVATVRELSQPREPKKEPTP